jgi:hypothetical protein
MSERPKEPEFRRFPHLPSKGVQIVTWDNIDRSKLPNFNAVADLPTRNRPQDGADAAEAKDPKRRGP